MLKAKQYMDIKSPKKNKKQVKVAVPVIKNGKTIQIAIENK